MTNCPKQYRAPVISVMAGALDIRWDSRLTPGEAGHTFPETPSLQGIRKRGIHTPGGVGRRMDAVSGLRGI
jgi:hypothetical protein